MRKPDPLPTCSAGRVSFLEGRASDNSSFHVEDKLVQSSGPSGRMKEWSANWDRVAERILSGDPIAPAEPMVYIDFSDEKNWIYNNRGECIGFKSKTPLQGQEAPPTVETETPPCKGKSAPLHIQLSLPFLPEMQYVDLSIYADNKGFIAPSPVASIQRAYRSIDRQPTKR